MRAMIRWEGRSDMGPGAHDTTVIDGFGVSGMKYDVKVL